MAQAEHTGNQSHIIVEEHARTLKEGKVDLAQKEGKKKTKYTRRGTTMRRMCNTSGQVITDRETLAGSSSDVRQGVSDTIKQKA